MSIIILRILLCYILGIFYVLCYILGMYYTSICNTNVCITYAHICMIGVETRCNATRCFSVTQCIILTHNLLYHNVL